MDFPYDTQHDPCAFEGCRNQASGGRGWCHGHYRQWMHGKELQPLRERRQASGLICAFVGCGRPCAAGGLCKAHHRQQERGTDLRPIGSPRVRLVNTAPRCAGPDCDLPPIKKQLCQGHYAQQLRGNELRPLRRPKPCSFPECDRRAYTKGLCSAHHQQRGRGQELRPVKVGRMESRLTSDGYLLVYVPDHSSARSNGYALQHLVVMTEHLGRPLMPGENVHHRNGDKADNRLANLELWSTSQPSGQRVLDKLAWAEEIIALYGGDRELYETV